MVNHYKLLIFLFLLFQSYLRYFCSTFIQKQILKDQNIKIVRKILIRQNREPQDEDEGNRDKERANLGDKEDIIKEYELLMVKEKELHQLYDKEYLIFKEQENQLITDKIYICMLIIIVSLLAISIIIYSCYELYKYRKFKKNLYIYGESLSKKNSISKEFKSSFESSKSTDESNKKNSSNNQSQNGDLNISSNFNIFIKDNKKDEDRKEEEIIIDSYNDKEDKEEAPLQFNKDNIYNLNNNNYNDDMKTLTNDENIYFASKTDKLLYKPYSREEINNK